MSHTETPKQRRVATVLKRMHAAVRNDPDAAEKFSVMLEELLTDLHGNDGFGTEGQCDPRGDFRNGEWFMARVEGIDTRVKQSKAGTTQQRVALVIERMLKSASENEDDADMFGEALDFALDEMLEGAELGPGGQDDPRVDSEDQQYTPGPAGMA